MLPRRTFAIMVLVVALAGMACTEVSGVVSPLPEYVGGVLFIESDAYLAYYSNRIQDEPLEAFAESPSFPFYGVEGLLDDLPEDPMWFDLEHAQPFTLVAAIPYNDAAGDRYRYIHRFTPGEPGLAGLTIVYGSADVVALGVELTYDGTNFMTGGDLHFELHGSTDSVLLAEPPTFEVAEP